MSKGAHVFNMIVGAGKATPQPPVGAMLGQRGLNLMTFCKDFNDRTKDMIENTPIPVSGAPLSLEANKYRLPCAHVQPPSPRRRFV